MQYAEGGNFADYLNRMSLCIPRRYLTETEITDFLAQVNSLFEFF